MFLSGGAGLTMVLPSSIERALAINPTLGSTFLDAEHIVILMQENRSFDHCFGTLSGVRGLNDPRAIFLPDKKPVWMQTNAIGETHVPFRLNLQDTKVTWIGDLPHSRSSQVDAYNAGKYDKWLDVKKSSNKKYENIPLTLGQYTRDDLPFHYAMADAFTICDQNYSSAMTSTTPNRSFFWTGKVTHQVNGIAKAHIRNTDFSLAGNPWSTFPELLEENHISWKFYQNALSCGGGFANTERAWLANFGGNVLEFFAAYHVKFTAKYVEGLQKRIIELPELIAKLQQEKASSPVAQKRILANIENKQAALNNAKAEYTRWNKESFDQLPEKAKELYVKAFAVNDGDPDYRSITTLQYNYQGSENETELPKGDILHRFRADVKANQLPTVSWLASPQNFSDHPSAPWYGAWYVSEVMDILTENPEVWKKTIFILTYDENDGYFDHIPPFSIPDNRKPETGKCSAGIDTEPEHVRLSNELKQGVPVKEAREAPIGLGFRVPMLIASPWTRGGKVCSEVFDHTSTLQFLETFMHLKFGKKIHLDNISKWRRTICGDLTSVFTPYNGEPFEKLPFIDRNIFIENIYNAKFKQDPAAGNVMLKQERGIRKSCALPYELNVNGQLSVNKKEFVMDFGVGKEFFKARAAGSPFTVYAPVAYQNEQGNGYEVCRNWWFAVISGDQINYSWPVAAFANQQYHLRVNGPNGFYREFLGNVKDPELHITCKPEVNGTNMPSGNMVLEMVNLSSEIYSLHVEDQGYDKNNYRIDLKPKARKKLVLELENSYNWYDFTVKALGFPDFMQGFAGRIENGKESYSDPKMA